MHQFFLYFIHSCSNSFDCKIWYLGHVMVAQVTRQNSYRKDISPAKLSSPSSNFLQIDRVVDCNWYYVCAYEWYKVLCSCMVGFSFWCRPFFLRTLALPFIFSVSFLICKENFHAFFPLQETSLILVFGSSPRFRHPFQCMVLQKYCDP